MKASGKMIYNMDKVLKSGPMVLFMMENTKKERSMEKVNSYGLMDLSMKANFLKTIFTVKESTNGRMVATTTENGQIINEREK